MGETKPEESLCTLDVAVVVANDHHVVLVPGRDDKNHWDDQRDHKD